MPPKRQPTASTLSALVAYVSPWSLIVAMFWVLTLGATWLALLLPR